MYLQVFLLCFLLQHSLSEVLDLTCADIREFVNGHNLRRLLIVKGEVYNQPPAADMKYMTWDNELAQDAARWAGHYTTEHDLDETINSDRFHINQNTFMVSDSDSNLYLNIDKVLDHWFNEYTNYTFGPYTSYGPEFGDYLRLSIISQVHHKMARSKTRYIGCGISKLSSYGHKTYYVVCNYGPSDDGYKTEEPYSTGAASDKLQCASDECNHPYGYTCS